MEQQLLIDGTESLSDSPKYQEMMQQLERIRKTAVGIGQWQLTELEEKHAFPKILKTMDKLWEQIAELGIIPECRIHCRVLPVTAHCSIETVLAHIQRICKGHSLVSAFGSSVMIPQAIHKKLEGIAQKSGYPLSKIVAWAGEELDRTGK
ncbi:hypothetical protein A2635_03215 [Candidatus Peribacteria bacterium RIFCSPHIGHO2_01_FULL_51_9]|nr:MAG: hypothetical protein A2635_03215 [Candidatus Peribacteria bacterium RIFCSPHIGHO2_01_FULL_51_9]